MKYMNVTEQCYGDESGIRHVVSWVTMLNRVLLEGSLTLESRFLKEETEMQGKGQRKRWMQRYRGRACLGYSQTGEKAGTAAAEE